MEPERVFCLGMFGFSGWEILIVLVIALLLFGRRLPDIMRGMGSSVREFKAGMSGQPAQHGEPAATTPPAVQPPQH